MATTSTNDEVLKKFLELYAEMFDHDGYGEILVQMRLQKAGQKEVILHCGKQHRYVVDFRNASGVIGGSRFEIAATAKAATASQRNLDEDYRRAGSSAAKPAAQQLEPVGASVAGD